MGSYSFKWEHPANEVYVTGTFDNWSKSVKLDKQGSLHEKTVELPVTGEKIFYKFVADGDWKTDHTAKSEPDHEGNINNVLYPADIASTAHISSVAPGATTTAMAGEQPIEKSSPPGAFPETPAATLDDERNGDGLLGGPAASSAGEQTVSVNPIPASEGAGNPITLAPGEKVPDPSTINNNTITSKVQDDPALKSGAEDSEKTLGISPIPATGGIGNPVHLQPGEPVPDASTLTGNTLTSNVKLDQASYESSTGAPQLPPAVSPQTEREAAGAPIFGLGPQTTGMIPESSLGMGENAPAPIEGAALSSVGPQSTTNALAGQQPLEPRGVPEVVSESQHKADVAPEASANPEAVQEKKAVEDELKAKVPEEQAGSSNTGITAAVAGGVAAAGAAAVGAGAYLRGKTHETTGTDPVSVLPQSVQDSINSTTTSTKATPTAETATTSTVPAEVTASQKEAHVAPEASSNPAAVQEKSAVEAELLSAVKETHASGEPAPTATAATSATAPTTSATGAPQLADPVGAGLAPISMDENNSKAPSSGLNAPAAAPAKPAADSADVSPLTSPAGEHQTSAGQTAPVVTTGVASSSAPTTSGPPVGTPRTGATATPQKRNSILERFKSSPGKADKEASPKAAAAEGSEKKKKGFFAKIKEKFKD